MACHMPLNEVGGAGPSGMIAAGLGSGWHKGERERDVSRYNQKRARGSDTATSEGGLWHLGFQHCSARMRESLRGEGNVSIGGRGGTGGGPGGLRVPHSLRWLVTLMNRKEHHKRWAKVGRGVPGRDNALAPKMQYCMGCPSSPTKRKNEAHLADEPKIPAQKARQLDGSTARLSGSGSGGKRAKVGCGWLGTRV